MSRRPSRIRSSAKRHVGGVLRSIRAMYFQFEFHPDSVLQRLGSWVEACGVDVGCAPLLQVVEEVRDKSRNIASGSSASAHGGPSCTIYALDVHNAVLNKG